MGLQRILFVDDMPDSCSLVRAALGHRYEVVCAGSGKAAKAELGRAPFDLIILDVGLPEQDGFKLCAEIRADEALAAIPVIFLTGRTDPADKVLGFKLGADDFICKPFEVREFCARVEARLRKSVEFAEREETYVKGVFRVHSAAQRISFVAPDADHDLHLTTIEFKLLLYFIRHEDHVLSRQAILDEVWGFDVNVTDRTVDTHVYTLRKKLGPQAHMIEAIPRVGYRFTQLDAKNAAGQ